MCPQLGALEGYIEALYSQAPQRMAQIVPSLMDGVVLLCTSSAHFAEQEHTEGLVRKISSQICALCQVRLQFSLSLSLSLFPGHSTARAGSRWCVAAGAPARDGQRLASPRRAALEGRRRLLHSGRSVHRACDAGAGGYRRPPGTTSGPDGPRGVRHRRSAPQGAELGGEPSAVRPMIIAGIWVAFFQEYQQYSCEQGRGGAFDGRGVRRDAAGALGNAAPPV